MIAAIAITPAVAMIPNAEMSSESSDAFSEQPSPPHSPSFNQQSDQVL